MLLAITQILDPAKWGEYGGILGMICCATLFIIGFLGKFVVNHLVAESKEHRTERSEWKKEANDREDRLLNVVERNTDSVDRNTGVVQNLTDTVKDLSDTVRSLSESQQHA